MGSPLGAGRRPATHTSRAAPSGGYPHEHGNRTAQRSSGPILSSATSPAESNAGVAVGGHRSATDGGVEAVHAVRRGEVPLGRRRQRPVSVHESAGGGGHGDAS